MAVQMAAMNPAFGRFAENMKNMTPKEFQDELKKLKGPLTAFRDSMGGTFADIPGHPFAALFDEIGNLEKYANAQIDFDELEREKNRRNRITDGITKFEKHLCYRRRRNNKCCRKKSSRRSKIYHGNDKF